MPAAAGAEFPVSVNRRWMSRRCIFDVGLESGLARASSVPVFPPRARITMSVRSRGLMTRLVGFMLGPVPRSQLRQPTSAQTRACRRRRSDPARLTTRAGGTRVVSQRNNWHESRRHPCQLAVGKEPGLRRALCQQGEWKSFARAMVLHATSLSVCELVSGVGGWGWRRNPPPLSRLRRARHRAALTNSPRIPSSRRRKTRFRHAPICCQVRPSNCINRICLIGWKFSGLVLILMPGRRPKGS